MSEHKNSKLEIRLPLYVAIAICIGIFIGANMTSNPKSNTEGLVKSLQKFRQILTYVENDYVDEVNTDELVEGAIANVLKELDPHSVYIPPKDLEYVQSDLDGKYEGIGVEFNIFKDTIYVVSPLSGGPSEKLGIQSGDKIVKVDGENVTGIGMTNRKVIDMLRGEKGSLVTVTIARKGQSDLIDFEIKRDVIPQFSIDVSYMVDDEVGYIKVSRFANSTFLEFKEALLTLKDQGMNKLILDLTGNPGGYLPRAVQIVDEVIGGEQLIVSTDGKEKRYTEAHFSGETGDFESGNLIIMLDEGSASASEIVAGAVQDHDRGIIVGRRSFGKGLVQRPIDLSDGSQLRLTISRYYTPSGRSIQKSYEGTLEDYHREAYERYTNGELYTADSIKVNDSLTYKTSNGRLVYGGGGITPDFFVPLDTTENSSYLNRLFSSNSMQEFTVKYAEENKKRLEKMGFDKFNKSFKVSDDILQELTRSAEKNDLKFNQRQFNKSKELIRLLTKAYIARGIWDNQGFYPIFNQQNEIYLKAVEVVDNADELILLNKDL